MLRLYVPSLSKAAYIAVAGLMLSLGATASYADTAEQLAIARESHSVAPHPDARALYPALGRAEADRQDQCVGGYRWIQREIDSNLSPGQQALPLPCS